MKSDLVKTKADDNLMLSGTYVVRAPKYGMRSPAMQVAYGRPPVQRLTLAVKCRLDWFPFPGSMLG